MTPDDGETRHSSPALPREFVVRTLFILGVVSLVVLGAKLAMLWVLLFGAVVVATILRSIADPLRRLIRLPEPLAVIAAVVIVLATVALVLGLFGYQIAHQAGDLMAIVPKAWGLLEARLQATPVGAPLLHEIRDLGGQADRVFALAPKLALDVLSAIASLALVIVTGIYLAMRPGGARDGALSLFPIAARPRLREVMDACGVALRAWFRAQMVSMILVGLLVGVGLRLLGIPSPLALGLLAGLAQFVPIVGPIVSSAPALVIAATAGSQELALTAALFFSISQLEANFITPMVQKSVAELPEVFGLFAVVGFTVLLGPLGGLFATPMALVIYTMITMLYRQDMLRDPDARTPRIPGTRSSMR